ncbi:hypothetical protein Tco_1376390 [Tanacetum coccineum]
MKTKHDIHPRIGSALHYSHEENILNTLRYIGKDGREIFGMPIPDTLLTDTIKRAPYYNGYLEHVAGPNPGDQDEGQAGSNSGDAAESQPQSSHVVPAGPNLEHMDLEATDASTQQKSEQMDEEFTITAYPNVQENLKLPTEDQVILEELASSFGTPSSL